MIGILVFKNGRRKEIYNLHYPVPDTFTEEVIHNDFLAADLAAVEALLRRTPEKDILTSLNLKSRRDELKKTLATLNPSREPGASAAQNETQEPQNIRTLVTNRIEKIRFEVDNTLSTESIKIYKEIE